jgi:hypothetical protein
MVINIIEINQLVIQEKIREILILMKKIPIRMSIMNLMLILIVRNAIQGAYLITK